MSVFQDLWSGYSWLFLGVRVTVKLENCPMLSFQTSSTLLKSLRDFVFGSLRDIMSRYNPNVNDPINPNPKNKQKQLDLSDLLFVIKESILRIYMIILLLIGNLCQKAISLCSIPQNFDRNHDSYINSKSFQPQTADFLDRSCPEFKNDQTCCSAEMNDRLQKLLFMIDLT